MLESCQSVVGLHDIEGCRPSALSTTLLCLNLITASRPCHYSPEQPSDGRPVGSGGTIPNNSAQSHSLTCSHGHSEHTLGMTRTYPNHAETNRNTHASGTIVTHATLPQTKSFPFNRQIIICTTVKHGDSAPYQRWIVVRSGPD